MSTDATQEPWDIAAESIATTEDPELEIRDFIRHACEQYAAALAQENQRLRDDLWAAVKRPKITQHWGDCTFYASMVNRRPTDGICTCGYGWTIYADSGGVDETQLLSEERLKSDLENVNLALVVSDKELTAARREIDQLTARVTELESKVPKQSNYFQTSSAQES